MVAAEALHECGPRMNDVRRTKGDRPSNRVLAKTRSIESKARASSRPRTAQSAISQRELKKRCNDAIKKASEALGNRVATCRKFYVHPKLADAYADGRLERAFRAAKRDSKPAEMSREERAVTRLMRMIQ